jgi:hypothetical protein
VRRVDLRSESGVTLIELTVAATIGVVISLALFNFIDTTSKSSVRTAARVDAAKLARPVMAGIMDRLHSTCVAPGLAPVLPGSSGTSISFVNQTGSAVSPVPLQHTISYAGGALTESTYPVSGGTAPDWTFSGTANYTRQMLKPVAQASEGSPSVLVPVFRYYAFNSTGQISATPLAVPLSDTDAASTVQVTVSFTVPPRTGTSDPAGSASFTDTALLRFTPPGESAAAVNLPCE